jgi:acyl-CoA synthetase (AMP-forming)/AMP-acid ligase II
MPGVADAVAFAAPNPVTGSVVGARLTLTAPEELAALRQRVREFCAPRLARFKIPVKIEIAAADAVSDRWKKLRPRDG